jgi:Rrf2 family protein
MKLQTNTALALYSVLEFAADPGRHVAAAEIADKYGVSPHHLAKVLALLVHAGIVESVRGVGGGYRFVANARRLTLMDVIRCSRTSASRHRTTWSTPGRRRWTACWPAC